MQYTRTHAGNQRLIKRTMQEEKTLKDDLGRLLKDFRSYLDARYDVARLDVTEKLIIIASLFITLIAVLFIVISFTLYASLSMAFYLNSVMHTNVSGFLIVGTVYLLLAVIVLVFRNSLITKPLLKTLIRVLLRSETPAEVEEKQEK